MVLARAREGPSRCRYSGHRIVANYSVFDAGYMAARKACTAYCQTYLDIAESSLSDPDWLDAAIDDRSELSASRAGPFALFSAASQPVVRSVLCASSLA